LGLASLSIVWGTQFLVIKWGQATVPPLLTAALRYAVLAAVAQAAILVLKPPPSTRPWSLRLGFGAAQAISMGLIYWSQGHIPSALVGVILATTPFYVAIMARAWLSEDALEPVAVMSTTLGFLGVTGITLASWAPGAFTAESLAVIAVVGAAAMDALNKVFAKSLTSNVAVPVMLRDMGVVVASITGMGWWLLERDMPVNFTPLSVAAFLYLGVVGSALASGLYLVLLQGYTASGLAYLQFVTALIAIAAGLVVENERPNALTMLGATAILAGLALRGTSTCRAAG
jgi:O-acetylserine/cysteine efflux transporter